MTLNELLTIAIKNKCSDMHITVGSPPVMRKHGLFVNVGERVLSDEDAKQIIYPMLSERHKEALAETGETDLAISTEDGHRFRINVFMQKNGHSAAIRLLNSAIPSFIELGLPETVARLANKSKGLVLVTGPTGSGKSTTLACMINKINIERDDHIITLEEPIEYLHSHKKSIINQREIGKNSKSFSSALRAALRQDPDVILIGEMRDLETIAIALTAAETGHLVLSTLHTIGAAKTIDRIIDAFPPHQQQQIRTQLSTVLQGVVSQQLIPKKDKEGRVAAVEVMMSTPAVRNLIREGKTFQIQNVMQTSASHGMKSMDHSIYDLYKNKVISAENAMMYSVDADYLNKLISLN